MKLSVITSRGLCAAAIVAAAGFAVSGFPAEAAPTTPTCDGTPATIVGTPSQHILNGTSGDDVIVTNGSGRNESEDDDSSGVFAGDGNDLICVTGGTTVVDAGAGDDTVDASESRLVSGIGLGVWLGAGADRCIDSPVGGSIYTGDTHDDNATDIVRGGPGNDAVYSGPWSGVGDPLVANHDIITTGKGDDDVTLSGVGATLDVGAGANSLILESAQTARSLKIDAPHGRIMVGTGVTPDRLVTAYKGTFTSIDADMNGQDNRFDFAGTDQREILHFGVEHFYDGTGSATGHVSLGGGNDYFAGTGFTGPVRGGRGHDKIRLDARAHKSVNAHMAKGLVVDGVMKNELAGVEGLWLDVTTLAKGLPVNVVGTGAANRIRVFANKAKLVVRGKGGDDNIGGLSYAGPRLYGGRGNDIIHGNSPYGDDKGMYAWGGPGKDWLVGGYGPDHLYGQSGRDRADGGHGRDVCSAEVRVSCHRP